MNKKSKEDRKKGGKCEKTNTRFSRIRAFAKNFFDNAIVVKTGGNAEANRPLGWFLIVIAIILFTCTVAQTLLSRETKEIIYVLNEKQGLLWITAGVNKGEGAFIKRVDAQPGDERLVQMIFRNISGRELSTLAGRIILPEGLEFVPESTIVYNRTNPRGIANEDGIASEWIDLGGYGVYDGQGRGEGSVSFKIKVSNNANLFVNGVNTLNICCQVGGYADERLVTEAYEAYAAVDVIVKNVVTEVTVRKKGTTDYAANAAVNPGDTVEILMHIRNVAKDSQTIYAHFGFVDADSGLTYVPGSAVLQSMDTDGAWASISDDVVTGDAMLKLGEYLVNDSVYVRIEGIAAADIDTSLGAKSLRVIGQATIGQDMSEQQIVVNVNAPETEAE